MSSSNIFTRFWAWLTNEAKNVPTIEHSIVTFADTVTNDLKTMESSKVAQYIETGLVAVAQAIDPALVPLIQGIENYIPKLIALVADADSVIDAEASKTLNQQATDGLAAIQGLKETDAAVYAGNLATVQLGISNYVTSNNIDTLGEAPALSSLISVGQAIHANSDLPAGTEDPNTTPAALPASGATTPASPADMSISQLPVTKAGNPAPATTSNQSYDEAVAADQASKTTSATPAP